VRTEAAYRWWIVRFVRFCGVRHPSTVEAGEAGRFLDWLAVERRATPSTRRQARASLVFLYRDVLGDPEGCPPPLPRSNWRANAPQVLTPDEVGRLLACVAPERHLAVALLYGAGLELTECITLRVSDVDFGRRRIRVRAADGGMGRFTVLPDSLRDATAAQVDTVRRLHGRDAVAGRTVGDWRSAWLFPAARVHMDRATGRRCRWHVVGTTVQRAVAAAAKRAGLSQRVTPRMLRHGFATHLVRTGSDVRLVQSLLGHRDVSTTMEYTHMHSDDLERGARSPLDLVRWTSPRG
jgi:site-specific recombinase XerD